MAEIKMTQPERAVERNLAMITEVMRYLLATPVAYDIFSVMETNDVQVAKNCSRIQNELSPYSVWSIFFVVSDFV